MIKIIKSSLISNIFLIISLILIVLSFIFSGYSRYQSNIIFVTIFFYLLFAFLHHHLDKSLTLTIVFEYILVAALALVVVFSISF